MSCLSGNHSVDLTDGRSVTYDHDPMGRRIAKKIDGTVAEKYFWRDNLLISLILICILFNFFTLLFFCLTSVK